MIDVLTDVLRDENGVCVDCDGSGTITDWELDHETHTYLPNGERECFCQLKK